MIIECLLSLATISPVVALEKGFVEHDICRETGEPLKNQFRYHQDFGDVLTGMMNARKGDAIKDQQNASEKQWIAVARLGDSNPLSYPQTEGKSGEKALLEREKHFSAEGVLPLHQENGDKPPEEMKLAGAQLNAILKGVCAKEEGLMAKMKCAKKELNRINAEQKRRNAELDRRIAEKSKKNAELERQNAEGAKRIAEKRKRNAEGAKALEEAKAELAREKAERVRAKAEHAREKAKLQEAQYSISINFLWYI